MMIHLKFLALWIFVYFLQVIHIHDSIFNIKDKRKVGKERWKD
jgi:hypothetical protein